MPSCLLWLPINILVSPRVDFKKTFICYFPYILWFFKNLFSLKRIQRECLVLETECPHTIPTLACLILLYLNVDWCKVVGPFQMSLNWLEHNWIEYIFKSLLHTLLKQLEDVFLPFNFPHCAKNKGLLLTFKIHPTCPTMGIKRTHLCMWEETKSLSKKRETKTRKLLGALG